MTRYYATKKMLIEDAKKEGCYLVLEIMQLNWDSTIFVFKKKNRKKLFTTFIKKQKERIYESNDYITSIKWSEGWAGVNVSHIINNARKKNLILYEAPKLNPYSLLEI